MRGLSKLVLLTGLAMVLGVAPLQQAQAEGSKKKSEPTWQIFKPGTNKTVWWMKYKPNPRFRIYRSGTSDPGDDLVWDEETDLVWQRSPSTDVLDFWGATNFCNRSKFGGRFGWRSPTVEEAGTLLDDTTADGLPNGHPFLNLRPFYWTSTTNPADPGGTNARGLNLGERALTINWKTANGRAWCVRGGVGHEAKYSY